MIILGEQFGYKNPRPTDQTIKFINLLKKRNYAKSIQRGQNKAYCFQIFHNEEESNPYRFETSYFVGIDWIVENELPIYVRPKLDDDTSEVNYIKMLFDVLKEPENYNHLDQLCEINFERPSIAIEQKEDLLTPLLLIQYFNILKKIVQKGLKKSYYSVVRNLNAKVKGKILINETIKKNHFNHKMLFSYCEFTEFGINSAENKILKKALLFSIAAIQNIKGVDISQLNGLVNYILPAFADVESDENIDRIKKVKPNTLYKEYDQALKFAKFILKRYGFNISTVNATIVNTPPFWIDMSKLFEMYVFAKLKERFKHHKEVTYHKKFNYLEPDFIIKTLDGSIKMVVDAKYKPRYHNGNINTEDIRQVSGYARLKEVYNFLEYNQGEVIDCLVVYSSQNANRTDFKDLNFDLQEDDNYVQIFKIGIELPIK
jgi:5-methylcytosine-specific restriction enzyme subunit McrC